MRVGCWWPVLISGKYIAIRRAADALLHHPQGVYTGLSARRVPAYAFTNTAGD